jgi:hypothetical protein
MVPFAVVVPCPIVNWLYGTAVAKTDAPTTARPPQAVTVKWRWIAPVERFTRGATVALEMSSRAGGVRVAIGIAPVPGGHPPGGTTAVAADDADVDPLPLCAVTDTRSVWPTSADVGV